MFLARLHYDSFLREITVKRHQWKYKWSNASAINLKLFLTLVKKLLPVVKRVLWDCRACALQFKCYVTYAHLSKKYEIFDGAVRMYSIYNYRCFGVFLTWITLFTARLMSYFCIVFPFLATPSKHKAYVPCLQNTLPYICEMILKMFTNITTFDLEINAIIFIIIS